MQSSQPFGELCSSKGTVPSAETVPQQYALKTPLTVSARRFSVMWVGLIKFRSKGKKRIDAHLHKRLNHEKNANTLNFLE